MLPEQLGVAASPTPRELLLAQQLVDVLAQSSAVG